MPLLFAEAAKRSIKNIGKYGDTDVFPFSYEKDIFHEKENECAAILEGMFADFDRAISDDPPRFIQALSQVGYTGFRWTTQIDPYWNAYYLALVLSIADEVESARSPITNAQVYSYRYAWNDGDSKIFSDVSWRQYKEHCLQLARDHAVVLVTDIADFYPRISHHRIENLLQRLGINSDTKTQILKLLAIFSNGFSYGLPVGGPASRILAELSLVNIDQHLAVDLNRSYARYADDFTFFCDSDAEAYGTIKFLSDKLKLEGLALQKSKTRILTQAEFIEMSRPFDQSRATSIITDEDKLLNISIRFDPYSPTAEEDYENLRSAINEIDILSILARELNKTVVDTSVTKQALNAVRLLPNNTLQTGALQTILDRNNLSTLSPVLSTVLRVVRSTIPNLSNTQRNQIDILLHDLIDAKLPQLDVDLHLMYFIQCLAFDYTDKKEQFLVSIYNTHSNPLVRRLIILAMAKWKRDYWLTSLRARFSDLTSWERGAVIISSYALTDEGSHWRKNSKWSWNSKELLIRDWFSSRPDTAGITV
ncbi:RNA-directed DNA polymerase [Algisphaera agarilytica]|uniref:Reverse transcriptase domain-containing protein n=1 Tax=Algisphaera agarilytica TaxID=1385975 RepID=A0A7X0H8S1_9BACT|nr:RNA-directed DNA polymerase [Algisphaera agarilytica]MBB6431382.1 hypothetical protein [Algisphaera agarilytica]